MKNNANKLYHYGSLIKTVRLTFILFFAFNLTIMANSFGQDKVSIDMKNANVSQILDEIEANTDYKFIYNVNVYDFETITSISVDNQSIKLVLDMIFNNQLDYEVIEKKIILKKKPIIPVSEEIVEEEIIQRVVTGSVTDSDGTALPGATILEVGTNNGTSTDFDVNFSI